MARFYGYKRLTKPEDWRGLGDAEGLVDRRAAYEVAAVWQATGGIPPAIRATIEVAGATALAGLNLEVAVVEKPAFLDSTGAPSMTDLMGYARNAADELVVIAVEGKTHEPFGLPVRSWLRGDAPG